nr:hypothetical protein AOSUZXEW_AOSUZXEW_CDS_0001 [Microvirus sp.]
MSICTIRCFLSDFRPCVFCRFPCTGWTKSSLFFVGIAASVCS